MRHLHSLVIYPLSDFRILYCPDLLTKGPDTLFGVSRFSTFPLTSRNHPLFAIKRRIPSARRIHRSAVVVMAFKSVSVTDAKKLQDEGHRYVDVRTPEEFSAGYVEFSISPRNQVSES